MTAWLVFGACAAEEPVPPVLRPQPARGVVLISIDTLRADHLGVYGYDRDTSPRLDRLAERSVVFDLAFAHSPSTLISHMSLFTSLLPPEHGVRPPERNVLSSAIPTLPEVFRGAGYHTAGFTEGGYMEGDHGFARGFEQWQDPGFRDSRDIEATLDRGLAFLRAVQNEEEPEPFFLFLHTYSVHDPYEPPAEDRHHFWPGAPPTDEPAAASTLEPVNAGRTDLDPEQVTYFASRYDDGIRYADRMLGRFVDALESLGLLDEITLMLMSDHGEEFLDHGRMLHTQVYPELLRVPLVVIHPGLSPRRVARPVRLVDVAPTLLDLSGLDPGSLLPDASGRSLMAELTGRDSMRPAEPVYAEVAYLDTQRTLISEVDGRLWQLVEQQPLMDADGAWISRRVETEVADEPPRRVGFRLASFRIPRNLRIERIGPSGEVEVLMQQSLPPEWTEIEVRLPRRGSERSRLRLSVDDCRSPLSLGLSDDPRCLGFIVAQPVLRSLLLLRLGADRRGRLKVSGDLSLDPSARGVLRILRRQLDSLAWRTAGDAEQRDLEPEERRALEALGYL